MSGQIRVRGGPNSRSDDSWVEVASQPSSSSLSSATDDIVTEGLRIQHDGSNSRRRHPLSRSRSAGLHMASRVTSAGGSSQEEYDESESDSDRAMASSSEALPSQSASQPRHRVVMSHIQHLDDGQEVDEDEDDENGTAVNVARASEPAFRPQPNAFTHPYILSQQRPDVTRRRTQVHSTSSSRPGPRTAQHQHHSFGGHAVQHSPFNVISPSYQADQDAALRASLSTLLSAAAARGKSVAAGTTAGHSSAPVFAPQGLRLVPESEILGIARPVGTITTTTSPPSERSSSNDKSKRPSSRERHNAKKTRRGGPAAAGTGFGAHNTTTSSGNAYGLASYSIDDISPTFLTWVVSAGVMVLVGALSFSAGYVVGREAGREDAAAAVGVAATAAGRCGGSEMIGVGRSAGGADLRRLRWSDGLSLAA